MVLVNIQGEIKKVACGPCIRGHRSTKCEHRDRILIEVRKPGRPLSGCPHPSGGCGCERTVINYIIPKESQCKCPSDPTDAPEAQAVEVSVPPSKGGANRIQKARRRKPSTGVPSNALQKVASSHSRNADQDGRSEPPRRITASSGSESGNGASPNSSNNSSDSEMLQRPVKQEESSRLRLGMLGVGGYRAAPDEMGWNTEWPDIDVASKQGSQPELPPDLTTKANCCGGRKLAPKQPSQNDPHSELRETGQTVPAAPPKESFLRGPLGLMPHDHQSNGVYGSVWTPMEGIHPTVAAFPAQVTQNNPSFNYQSAMIGASSNDLTDLSGKNCNCGDGCACLGCAEHPQNQTTLNYVRDTTALMLHSSEDISTPIYGAPFVNFPQTHLNGLPERRDITCHNQAPVATQMDQTPWPSMPLLSENGTHGNGDTGALDATGTAFQLEGTDLESENTLSGLDDQLSPSLYSFNAFEFSSCGEAGASCPCGPGCECVDCLTHGRRDGTDMSHGFG